MHYSVKLFSMVFFASAVILAGCESEDVDFSNSSSNSASVSGEGDEVDFGSLKWTFGGENGAGAQLTSATIANLSASGDGMSYQWAGDTLRSWGLSDSQAGAFACFFVQKSDGSWVGGKFDWISTSRTTRGFENILHENYVGWTLVGVPNPCNCAFVIISEDCTKRTNVIAGTWSR